MLLDDPRKICQAVEHYQALDKLDGSVNRMPHPYIQTQLLDFYNIDLLVLSICRINCRESKEIR